MAWKNLRAEIEEEFESYSNAGEDDYDVFRRLEVTGGGRESALRGRLADAGFSVEVAKVRSGARPGPRRYEPEQLRILLDRTVPSALAAARVGVCSQTVFYRRKHGAPRKQGPKSVAERSPDLVERTAGLSLREAAAALGVHPETARRARAQLGLAARTDFWGRLPEETRATLLDTRLTNAEVVRRTGLDPSWVYSHRNPRTREMVLGRTRESEGRQRGHQAHNRIQLTPEQLAVVMDPKLTGAEVMALTGLSENVVYTRRKGLRPRGRNKNAK